MLKKVLELFFQNNTPAAIILIVLGTFVWSLTMVKSGIVYDYGMGFWGPNGHDGVWHIAVAESLARGSYEMPVFAGESLKNYHIGFNLILAILHKITSIPVHTLYFQLLPPLIALLIGCFVYKFVYLWKGSETQALFATFFTYFGGSWGWVVSLIRSRELGGESMFWSQQAISTLINPPFALSLVLLFAGLYFLTKYTKHTRGESRLTPKVFLIISTLLFGILAQIKVYASILILGGLFLAGLWDVFQKKRTLIIKMFASALILSILIIFPVLKNSGQMVIFKPFWFLETVMDLSDRFYWPRFAEAMVNYKLSGNWVKAIPAYIVAFMIFWFGNLGTRVFKEPLIFNWLKNWKGLTYTEIIFVTVIGAGILFPTFFVQAGTPWNTIQFMYYSLMFSGILAGVFLGKHLDKYLAKKKSLYDVMIHHTKHVLLVVMVVILTIPTTIGTLTHYLPSRPPARISQAELNALAFLAEQPVGVVLTYPFDRQLTRDSEIEPPRPLYLYESTAYVSAFSKKPVFLEDEVNLDITGYDWRIRRSEVLGFLESQDIGEVRNFLSQNNIAYIYWLRDQRAVLGEGQLGIEIIFENDEVQIFKVIDS